MSHQLHLDPTTHTYTYRGMRVPGVTAVLRDWHRLVVRDTTSFAPDERYLERGRRIHAYVAALLHDGDICEVDDESLGYVRAAQAAIDALGLRVRGARVEVPVFCRALWVAGTPDYVGRGQVADWKVGSYSPIGRWQLGAYALLARARAGVEVRLCSDGTYSTRWHDVERAAREFTHILASWRIAEQARHE